MSHDSSPSRNERADKLLLECAGFIRMFSPTFAGHIRAEAEQVIEKIGAFLASPRSESTATIMDEMKHLPNAALQERERRMGLEANPQGLSAKDKTRRGNHASPEHGEIPDPAVAAYVLPSAEGTLSEERLAALVEEAYTAEAQGWDIKKGIEAVLRRELSGLSSATGTITQDDAVRCLEALMNSAEPANREIRAALRAKLRAIAEMNLPKVLGEGA